LTRLATALLAAFMLSGCGNVLQPPEPTPGSMDDVIAGLVLQGASVHNLTSGDAGCPSSSLHDNAVRFDLALGSQSATHQVYLIRWRRAADYQAGAQDFAECVAEFEALNPGRAVATLEIEPWRAYYPDLSPQVGQVLADALRAAGGG
jgi:hypothetical protein